MCFVKKITDVRYFKFLPLKLANASCHSWDFSAAAVLHSGGQWEKDPSAKNTARLSPWRSLTLTLSQSVKSRDDWCNSVSMCVRASVRLVLSPTGKVSSSHPFATHQTCQSAQKWIFLLLRLLSKMVNCLFNNATYLAYTFLGIYSVFFCNYHR